MSTTPHLCFLARTSIVEDARNLCVLFTQEETFLASVPVLTFISFFMSGVGNCLEEMCKVRRNIISEKKK